MKGAITLWHRIFRGWTYSPVALKNCPSKNPAERALQLLKSRHYRSFFLVTFIGFICLFGGIFILIVGPYDYLFKWKCVFGEGGEIFELWRNPPVDLYLKVYLWNVTNHEEFLSGREDKLKMVEVGPYVYKELLSHDNITFNSNGTLTAIPRHPLVWMPELSEGRQEDDILILPNIALLSIAHVVSDQSYFTRLGLNLLIRQTQSQPLIPMTAKEFMFGYKSTLMTLGYQFMPGWISFDKLGLIDRMYDFDGDYETVFTGELNVNQTGLVDSYRGSTVLPQWAAPCGSVRGASDGTKFPSFIQPDDQLLFFRKSMCRAKSLVRVNQTRRDGLDAYVYHFQGDADDNGRLNVANKCFCTRWSRDECLPNGLLDVHGCYYGFPIALSYPHFLDGDAAILNERVIGSRPDPDLHKSYFVIQPDSGLPLDLAVRYQINMALGDIKTITNTERFHRMVLPLLWTEIRLYSLPEMLSARFRLYLKVLPTVQEILMYSLFLIGSVFLVGGAYISLRRRYRQRSRPQWNTTSVEMGGATDLGMHLTSGGEESGVVAGKKPSSMSAKELEVYYSGLMVVPPLHIDMTSDVADDDVIDR